MGQTHCRGLHGYCLKYSFLHDILTQGYRNAATRISIGRSVQRSNQTLFSYRSIHTAAYSTFTSSYLTMNSHVKARCHVYPRKNSKQEDVCRFVVPDDKVSWAVDFPEYQPIEFTAPSVECQPIWADIADCTNIDFNVLDEGARVDRQSKTGEIQKVNGRPRNVIGRTGVTGRGCLGRWGPNHAADPIVTRWKRDENKEVVLHKDDDKPILQFVAVQRRDNGQWALPGGMVDIGEEFTATLKREFGEEALNSLEATEEEQMKIKQMIAEGFEGNDIIYEGYVDDPRNTDHAWMETRAMNFHDEVGTGLGAFKLSAGDDAQSAAWKDMDQSLELYASHKDFIKKTVDKHKAHW